MSLLSVAFDTGQESTSGMHASTSATTAAGSDETLLARYRKGDSAAFEVLYQRHRQGLYRTRNPTRAPAPSSSSA